MLLTFAKLDHERSPATDDHNEPANIKKKNQSEAWSTWLVTKLP